MTKPTEKLGPVQEPSLEDWSSEALFRVAFENAGKGIAHVALNGAWLRVNQNLCSILGYTEEDLLRTTLYDLTFPADREAESPYFERIQRGELETFTLEKRFVRRDGRVVWANQAITVIRTDGASDYLVSVIDDIDGRKAVEEALVQEKDKFRRLTEVAAEYFWETDAQLRITAFSTSIARLSGVSHERFVGKVLWEVPSVDVTEDACAGHRALLEARLPFRRFETGLVSDAGKVRWLEMSGDPVWSSGGEFLGYCGVSQDITERKLREQQLRQHAMFFENSQEGVVITDPDGRIVSVNASFERITEYKREEVVGHDMRIVSSGRQDAEFYRRMWHAVETTGFWEGEIWNRRKSGEVYREWISVATVKDEAGKVVAYVGTHIDINRMHHVQSEMERLAFHDTLTGLPNRLLLISRLQHAVERAKRGTAGAVFFLDLDGFKHINDTLGHHAGDELLLAVSTRLGSRLRDVDTLARLGGDEFVVVLEDLRTSDAAAMANELLKQVSSPFDLGRWGTVQISGSVGIAIFPRDGTAVDSLIDCADHGMYVAKSEGKNSYHFCTD